MRPVGADFRPEEGAEDIFVGSVGDYPRSFWQTVEDDVVGEPLLSDWNAWRARSRVTELMAVPAGEKNTLMKFACGKQR